MQWGSVSGPGANVGGLVGSESLMRPLRTAMRQAPLKGLAVVVISAV